MATDTLTTLKSLAKKLARLRRLQHVAALEIIALEVGKANWRGLTESYKQGWRPDPVQMERAQGLFSAARETPPVATTPQAKEPSLFDEGLNFTRWVPEDVKPMEADEIHGELDGQKFYMAGDAFSVAFGSQGWEIILDQPPSAKPKLLRLGGRVKSVKSLDPAFVERATRLLMIRARRMHSEVASDWPRRSTMPDKQGRARHPLGRGLSDEWHCLHCDGVHDGRTMAKNLWHCTPCGATPIDIFPVPFWNGPIKSA